MLTIALALTVGAAPPVVRAADSARVAAMVAALCRELTTTPRTASPRHGTPHAVPDAANDRMPTLRPDLSASRMPYRGLVGVHSRSGAPYVRLPDGRVAAFPIR